VAERLTAVVDANVTGFLRGMRRVDSALATSSHGMASVGRGMGGIGKVGGAALLGVGAAGLTAGAGIAVMGVKFASMKQQALTSFRVLLGSGAKAQSMFDGLNRFAAETPFEFPEIAGAAQRMLAMGWNAKSVEKDLRVMGDAAAASPDGMNVGLQRITTALGQMKAKGKVTAEEMMQLTESGVPAWKMLADAAGMSVAEAQKAVTDGTISADQGVSAILAGMKKKYGGMMKEQSKTLAGSFSTLKDNLAQGAGAIMQPLMPLLTKATQGISNALASPQGQAAIASMANGVQVFAQAVGQVVGFVVAHWPQISAVVGTVVSAVQSVIGQAVGVVRAHWTEITAAGQSFVAWAQGTLWPAISSVVNMLIALWDTFGPAVIAVFTTVVQNVIAGVDGIVQVVGHLADAVSAILHGDWGAAWDAAGEAVSAAWETIKTQAGNVKDNLGPIMLEAGEWASEQLGKGLDKAGDAIADALGAAWDSLASGEAFSAAGSAMESLAEFAGEQLGNALEALGGIIQSGLQAAWDSVSGISWSVNFSMGGKTFGLGPLPDITVPYPTGIQFGATGGRFDRMAIIGEAGPEWVIPTDPKYRQRALGLLAGAAGELGVPMHAAGKPPALSATAVNFKRWRRYGLSRREQQAQTYSDDTALVLRGYQRDGTVTQAEYADYVARLTTYRRMLMNLLNKYRAESNAKVGRAPAKPGAKATEAERAAYDRAKAAYDAKVQKRDTAKQKRADATRAYLQLAADIQDAQYEAAAAPAAPPTSAFSLDGIAGLASLNEQIAIADAGLGGNKAELLKQKRDLLMAAFRSSSSQSDRAMIAAEIASVDSMIGSGATGGGGVFDATGGATGGGGGGGGPTTVTNTLNLYVDGSVSTESDLAQAMRRILIEWGRSNGTPIFAGYA
jgi:tape measure domain-containing protein